MPARRVAVLGSTGSVGAQALDVVARHPERLQVVALATATNHAGLAEQVRRWRPALAALATEDAAAALRAAIGNHDTEVVWGPEGLKRASAGVDADVVVNAVVGAAGLAATWEAVAHGIDVALANKESLVMAGELVMASARQHGAAILPVDSEPNALHQCLRGTAADQVRRLVLTASGGPFRGCSAEELSRVTPERALDHPTWEMGPRITVDSATLMNKGFEVIETHWLFGVPVERIDVVVHPQSIVHSLVELIDGSIIAHAGPTDMRLPIQDALAFPERWQPAVEPLDLVGSAPWTFEPADPDRYPALGLCRLALEQGGTAPAILNAADEVAVAAFLAGRVPFDRIVPLAAEVLDVAQPTPAADLDAVFAADAWAREETQRRLET